MSDEQIQIPVAVPAEAVVEAAASACGCPHGVPAIEDEAPATAIVSEAAAETEAEAEEVPTYAEVQDGAETQLPATEDSQETIDDVPAAKAKTDEA